MAVGIEGSGEINNFSPNPISSAFKSNLSPSQFVAISFWSQADQEKPIARVLGSSPCKSLLLGLDKAFRNLGFLNLKLRPNMSNQLGDRQDLSLVSPSQGAELGPKSLNSQAKAVPLSPLSWKAIVLSSEGSIQHARASAVQTRRNQQVWT